MFPLSLVGIVGLLGISSLGLIPALNAYMASPFFQPVLILSILLLIFATLPLGKITSALSLAAGILIFISMNLYMQAWLFLLAFFILGAAHIWGRFMKLGVMLARDIAIAGLPFIILAAILGITTYLLPSSSKNRSIQPSGMPSMMQVQ